MIRLLVLFALALTVLTAHHTVSAEFDVANPREYRATVVRTEWMNPHVLAFATVEGREFAFEFGAPNSMIRNGWTKDMLKEGTSVTIVGYPSKDGSAKVNTRRITWADGTSRQNLDYWGMTPDEIAKLKQ